jgi:glycosyltransferase involved in cell wall biosynthesis
LDLEVVSLVHPGEMPNMMFSMDRFLSNPRVVSVGQWMRDLDAFNKLDSVWGKIRINLPGVSPVYSSDIEILEFQSNYEYDRLLSQSIVFLHFYDVAACNTIIECIMSNTPVVTNRLPASEEYLGKDYPLFYKDIEDASILIRDLDLIDSSHEYLKHLDKNNLSRDCFVHSLRNSVIYQNLPQMGFT